MNPKKRAIIDTSQEDAIRDELAKTSGSKRKRIFSKLVEAALGSIPWVGGFLSAMVEFKSEEGQIKTNHLYERWLTEHSNKMRLLGETIAQITERLDEFPEEIDERLESEEFSQIVRKSFRIWDNTDTQEKKDLIRKLLTNAGATKLVPDDLIRLFLDWISTYHEAHFAVIKEIYRNPYSTRFEIWSEIYGTVPRENSAEADLFKLLIHDLSTGRVIRQQRVTNYNGQFVKKTPSKRSAHSSNIMKSAFDDGESYELTELGKQFVHYTMNEVVTRVE